MAKKTQSDKKTGQSFHQSDEKLGSLLDELPVCIAYIDREQRYRFNNKTYAEWFGISPDQMRGKHVREVLGEKTYESIREHIEKALSGQNVHYQSELTSSDGRTRIVEVNLMPRFDKNGDVEGCSSHLSDVSESVRINNEVQGKLRFQELLAKLSSKFVNLPASEVDRNINEGLQLVNELVEVDEIYVLQFQAGQANAGITHGWFKSGKVRKLEFDVSEFIHVFPWAGKKILANEVICFEKMEEELPAEAYNERKYLSEIGIESVVVIPLFAGKKNLGALFVHTLKREKKWSSDLVNQLRLIGELFSSALDRKNTADTLAASQLRLSSFMENSPAWIYIKDLSYRHIYGNKSLLNLLNLKLNEFIGTTSHDFMPEDVANRIEEYDREVMEKGVPVEIDEYNFNTDSELHNVWEIKFPITLYSGEVGVGGIVMDITTLKNKEERLQKAYDEIRLLKESLEQENVYLREQISVQSKHDNIIGKSDAMKYVLYKIRQVAPSGTTVLILGETGTGKELVAEAIHRESSRRDHPLVKVNCAALPANLIESELFGREKGAFTGSMAKQIGRFELADTGTLFLDEVGELPLELQAKLLRAIQSGEFERLGSPHTVKVDVRIIASTNRDLIIEIKKGRFREDLYYRLNVFPVTVPPLRDRTEDIPLLVKHFLNIFGKKIGKEIKRVPYESIKTFQEYHWPGNVRELENIIERSMIITPDSTLHLENTLETSGATDQEVTRHTSLSEMERDHILKVLKQTRWKIEGKNGAAESLDINPSTLRTRMRKLGIHRSRENN